MNLGKFMLEEKLGEGGMGEVWLAHDTELDRRVALKFMKGFDEEQLARFHREAQLAAKLNHPNIASVYEIGEDHGRHYIAMQYINGYIIHGGDVKLLVRLMMNAARAIAFAHREGVIHRDIKPANIMVEEKNRKHRVYVMDFGLARSTKGASNLSASGLIVGTPSYMSPEQARGEKVDERTDVYSLGVTLYELLAGQSPFKGKTIYETLKRVEEDDPQPIEDVDSELQTIVMKCLEKDKRARYQTAGGLAADLDRWLKGEPILAHAPSVIYRAKKFMFRRRNLITAVVLGALLPLAAVGIIIWQKKKAEEGFKTAHEKVERDRLASDEKAKREGEKRAEETKRAEDEKKRAAEESRRKDAQKSIYEAMVCMQNGNYDRAIEHYSAAMKSDPTNVTALANRAVAKVYKLDYIAAIEDASDALKIDPNSTDALGARATAYMQMKNYDGALPDFNRMIELNPKALGAYGNRAQIRSIRGDVKGAISDIEMLLKIAPADYPPRKLFTERLRSLKEKGN